MHLHSKLKLKDAAVTALSIGQDCVLASGSEVRPLAVINKQLHQTCGDSIVLAGRYSVLAQHP
jgi:hypothetical protein